jgi:serine/threonine-protein kinase
VGAPVPRPGNRRNLTVVVLAAAAVAIVIGLSAVFNLRPDGDEAQAATGSNQGGPDLGLAGPAGGGAAANPSRPGTSKPGKVATRPSAVPTTTAPVADDPTGDPTGDPTQPAGTPTSTAATNPHTPKAVCGSGFSVIDQAPLKADGTLLGRVYLLFNASTGKNCTVTLKTTDVGKATPASAFLEVQGGARVTDSGDFGYYAGPVRAKADGVCVEWGGSIGDITYESPFEHCD